VKHSYGLVIVRSIIVVRSSLGHCICTDDFGV